MPTAGSACPPTAPRPPSCCRSAPSPGPDRAASPAPSRPARRGATRRTSTSSAPTSAPTWWSCRSARNGHVSMKTLNIADVVVDVLGYVTSASAPASTSGRYSSIDSGPHRRHADAARVRPPRRGQRSRRSAIPGRVRRVGGRAERDRHRHGRTGLGRHLPRVGDAAVGVEPELRRRQPDPGRAGVHVAAGVEVGELPLARRRPTSSSTSSARSPLALHRVSTARRRCDTTWVAVVSVMA